MLQYFFCLLLSIGTFGYASSIEECSCNEDVEVITTNQEIIIGDVIMN